MPNLIPTYYLILSASNLAVLTFAYRKIFAPAMPALVAKRQSVVSRFGLGLGLGAMGMGAGITGMADKDGVRRPFPRGGHSS
jgi:hypothetical protein